MTQAADTTDVAHFHAHLIDHLGRPRFVTSGGQTEAVVLSPIVFDELIDGAELARSLDLLDQSGADVVAGRIRPAGAALRSIADEFGQNPDRYPLGL